MKKFRAVLALALALASSAAVAQPGPGQVPPGCIAGLTAACTAASAAFGALSAAGVTNSTSSLGYQISGVPAVTPGSGVIKMGNVYHAIGIDTTGATSSDAALAAAVATCAASGATLILPAGKILLNGTGSASILLENCNIVGAGMFKVGATTPGSGTTILLTSTTIKPFVGGKGWSFKGVNFYWPNQVAPLIVYPPLFSLAPGKEWVGVHLNGINIINAYDGFKQFASGESWGDTIISDSWIYAVHDAFAIGGMGDFFTLTNVSFTPGPWLATCSFAASCTAAIDAGISGHNNIFHALNKGSGPGFVLTASPINAFGWNTIFMLDSGASVGLSFIQMDADGIGTVIDASSGGVWQYNSILTGNLPSCGLFGWSASPPPPGNAPCYNMGANSSLNLNGVIHAGPVRGSFILSSGSPISLTNSLIPGIGQAADGADYYVVRLTAGSPVIEVNGNAIAGRSADTKVHGVVTTGATPVITKVVGNTFSYFNDVLTLVSAPLGTVIANNVSFTTQGTVSVAISGTSGVNYTGNRFDKPPNATTSLCGTGSSASGAFGGYIAVGSTNPTTTCTLLLPFSPVGGTGHCVFQMMAGQTITGAGPSGAPPSWVINFSATAHSQTISFNCPGTQ